MSDEKVLNADIRYLPIEVAGHKVTVDALINVAVGLEWGHGIRRRVSESF